MWTVTGLYKTNELVGELVYTTQHGSSHSKTNDIQVVSFYLERQIVRSDAKNTKGNFLLESGDHTFRLHDNLPPTLEQTRHNGPYIRYVVRIQIGIKRISNEHLLLLFDVVSHQCEMIKQIENTFVHVCTSEIVFSKTTPCQLWTSSRSSSTWFTHKSRTQTTDSY